MLILMIAEAMLTATTTWLVINAGRKVASGHFLLNDLIRILSAQSTSYVAGVISWIFAERAGYRGFGQFMLRFARENRDKVKLFGDKPSREQVEPFLTGEAFQCFFSLIYELEFTLKLFLGLVFNALVLGTEIDLSLPFAYIGAFGALLLMQWTLQKPIARTYLENQRMNNRVTAQGYTAWDNVFSGNRYNLRLWLGGFKSRLREALTAQVRAIVAREGMSAMSGIVSLGIVFATITFVAVQNVADTTLLIALATTLPRQIEMTYELHLLATGWNDFVAVWTRFGGVAANMLPEPDQGFDAASNSTGWCCARAITPTWFRPSTMPADRAGAANRPRQYSRRQRHRQILAARQLQDRTAPARLLLAGIRPPDVRFAGGVGPVDVEGDDDEKIVVAESMDKKLGFSTGERQLKSLEEIVNDTDARVYLLDEWDANLDAANKAKAEALVDALAARARVVEISHRDRAA